MTTICLGLLGGGAAAAQACTATWTGGGGNGNWGDAMNWSPASVPGVDGNTNADVCLPAAGAAYTVTLAPFQNINNINNPPVAQLVANSLTISSGATLVIHGASSNGNYSSSGDDLTALDVTNGGSIAAGGALELLATDDNDGGGASDNGGRGEIEGATITNSGTFTSVSQTTQGSVQSHQNELGASLTDLPGSSATVASGTLRVDLANHVTNQSTWTVASGATMSLEYNGFNQGRQAATGFTNDGSFVNNGTTVVAEHDHGGVGDEESNPITWTQQGGSVVGNPVQLTDGAELSDAAGSGSFIFNDQEGQLAGTIPAGQTVTVEADAYGNDTYINSLTLVGTQLVNQGTLVLHTPAVSPDDSTGIRVSGAPIVNQGTITSTSDVSNLINELDVGLDNQHGAALNVTNGTLQTTGGQSVTNDGTITIAPTGIIDETANEFLTGPETFTNAADGTIVPQLASASSIANLIDGPDSTFNLAGTVSPQLVGGFVPGAGQEFGVFPTGSSAGTVSGTFGAVTGGFTADYSHSAYIGLVYGPVAATPAPPAIGTGGSGTRPPSAVHYAKPAAHDGALRLTLSCTAGSGCPPVTLKATITEKVKAKRHHRAHTRKVVLASHVIRLTAGHRRTVSVALNKAGKVLLARRHRLTLTVTLATRGRVRHTYTVRLSEPKKRHHKKK